MPDLNQRAGNLPGGPRIRDVVVARNELATTVNAARAAGKHSLVVRLADLELLIQAVDVVLDVDAKMIAEAYRGDAHPDQS